jgi:hypothetical protein
MKQAMIAERAEKRNPNRATFGPNIQNQICMLTLEPGR